MDIRNLELTENDFKLLIEGLDSLPEKGMAGEIIGMVFEGLLADKNPEAQAKIKADREEKMRSEKHAKESMKEEIKILQGKLLMFKRYLIEIDALKQVNELLS